MEQNPTKHTSKWSQGIFSPGVLNAVVLTGASQLHGLMCLPQHQCLWEQESRLWPRATSCCSGDLCLLTAGPSYTCIFVQSCNVPTPPCSGMAWSSLTMRLCATALQEPHWGWLQERAQNTWERSLGTGTDPSLTHIPLWLYLKLTWHTQLAQTRMAGKDNCTVNALQITVRRSFIRITNYSLWKAVCCRGQLVQN